MKDKEPKEWRVAIVELHRAGCKYEGIQKTIEDRYGEERVLSMLRGTKRNVIVPVRETRNGGGRTISRITVCFVRRWNESLGIAVLRAR